MSRNTLRIIIVLAAVSILGITLTQVYWVRKAFDLREKQFNRDVQTSLDAVANRIFEINKTPVPTNSPVDQLSTNYFVVLVNGPVNSSVLGVLISSEFEKRKITADYEYGVYDCQDQCMKGSDFKSHKVGKAMASLEQMPVWKNDGYYFAVQFSRIEANLISQMGIWIYSSAVMLVVIFFFVYTLFVILKQKRLSEIQRDFINNMTHEFKTPLSTIAISSEVLRDPLITNTPERLLNYATIIQNETNRLKQHVERVLQMARLEKSDVALRKEKLDVHELIRDAVQNSALLLQEKKGEIDLQLNARHSWITADKLHFTNVLFNLIDNAIKYNQQQPKLIISTVNVNDHVTIEVKDNGIGINSENQRKIFHQFYRVPTGNLHDVKGFGLGLNYVKLMVEAHRGKISVESELDKGSTFKIVLPTA
ncbi:MAG: HAMP domain-containing histidine kinase [Bacteroidetes bacterium]|nr:HAMP domain-containing histidine kinase [Bacteroidota bacterium]MBI3482441.1 HAMP domain-containing histidine kinase [Bacteroidota bacterium]